MNSLAELFSVICCWKSVFFKSCILICMRLITKGLQCLQVAELISVMELAIECVN